MLKLTKALVGKNNPNLENEVVGQNFDSNVVLVRVLIDCRGPEGQLQQGLEPGGVNFVGLEAELIATEVHELDDEVTLKGIAKLDIERIPDHA